jgi:hypothetical protein
MLWQVSLPQGSAAKVGDWSGWKVGAGKQALQGAHCDHTSGLVMSRIPEMFCGDYAPVPTERLKIKRPAVSAAFTSSVF